MTQCALTLCTTVQIINPGSLRKASLPWLSTLLLFQAQPTPSSFPTLHWLHHSYPHILVTAGLHDPRVGYWEPAKLVARLRAAKTDGRLLLFKCELGAGHFSVTGR